MASSYPLQSDLPICKHHVNEQLNYYCHTCNLRVCEECCHGRHMTHKWMSNKKIARWIRQNAEARCGEIEEIIRGLESEDIQIEADIFRIEAVRRKWITVINNTADSMVEKRKAGKITTEELTRIKKMLTFFQKHIREADDIVAVEMEEEFHKKKQSLSSHKASEKKLKFKEGDFSSCDIQNMFGDIVDISTKLKVKVIEKSSFTHINNTDKIYRIDVLQNDNALLMRSKDKHIDHVDMTGNIIKRLSFDVGYFVQLGVEIVFTDFGNKKIRRITPSGTESDICSTAPLHPDCICISYDGGLLVALCSCNANEILSDSYGEIHHIDTTGGIIKKYSHTEDKRKRLFTCPRRVVQNKNTDLCVVEYIDREFRSRLVVMSTSSKIKFTYSGQPDLKKIFSCNDIVCDQNCRILLADLYNKAVHILLDDGQFLQYVLTERNLAVGPQSLGLYGGTLWVGCSKGVVKVFKYNTEKQVYQLPFVNLGLEG